MPRLTWTGDDGVREHDLAAVTLIGRGGENDIQLSTPTASTCHARVVCDGGGWFVEDNQSTNGTLLNGELCDRQPLRDGDVIAIGGVELRFANEPPPVPAPSGSGGLPSSTVFFRKGDLGGARAGDAAGTVADVLGTVLTDASADAEPQPASSMSLASEGARAALLASQDAEALRRRLQATYEISKAVAASLDLPEIMDRVLTALFEIFRAADRTLVLLADPQSGDVNAAAVRRRSEGAERIAVSRTALRHAMDRREAILCLDAQQDARYAEAMSIVSSGIRSMMIAPLLFQDQVLGAIYVDSRKGVGQFTNADLDLLVAAAGQVAGCVANARLHEQVVKSERLAAVGQTVAGLSHCIGNILQGIQGGAYIVDNALQNNKPEGITVGWEMVKRNQAFMQDLVYDLLSYSKERKPVYTASDVNALCAEVCELARVRAGQKGVAIEFAPGPGVGEVELDATPIRRGLLNLVVNGVDACEGRSEPRVTVSTQSPAPDGLARILIRDTGCGMDEETLAKVFQMFFSTKKSKGTGLGLPVTKKIVEEHGGRLEVDSTPGQGTTFTICLPPKHAGTEETQAVVL
jgi:signal transduction histidine kinase